VNLNQRNTFRNTGFKDVSSAGRSLYRGFTAALNVRHRRYTMDIYCTRSWNYSYDDVERGFTSGATSVTI
jgi:hypothetical protein